ncbi:MAG: helix-turn-helix transcriptional regulator [Methylocella sp.]
MNALRKFRVEAGLSLKQLADSCQSTSATLSRVERGRQTPSFDLLERIMGATGGAVTPNDFLSTKARARDTALAP